MAVITVHGVLLVQLCATFAVLPYQYLTVRSREDELYIGDTTTMSDLVALLYLHLPSVVHHLSQNLGERSGEIIMPVYDCRFRVRWEGDGGYSRRGTNGWSWRRWYCVNCAGEDECVVHRDLSGPEFKTKRHVFKERRTVKQFSNTSWRVA